MNSSTAATLPLAHTSSKYRRTRASLSCADTNVLLVKPLSPSGCRLLSIGEHDATLRDALHRLETYSPSCLEGEFSEVRRLRGYAPRCGSWHHSHRWEGFDPLGF